MSTAIVIHWIERGSDLLEARAVLPDGRDVFAGYVAASPGQSAWRGYVGSNFAMQHGEADQQRAALEWDGGGEDGGADTRP